MQKLIFFIVQLSLLVAVNVCAQNIWNIESKVDERIELLSIVCRLAEFEEYVNNEIPNYSQDVDNYFSKFKSHSAIAMAKELNEEKGISYDAIASFATSITIEERIYLKENITYKGIDKRWDKESIEKFIPQLNLFYNETNFVDFFNAHKDFYKVAEKNYNNEIIEKIDFTWFKKFYGTSPNANHRLMLGLLNGTSQYGVTSYFNDGNEEINVVIGVSDVDSLGQPIFPNSERNIQTVIHEFSHSYCNRIIDAYYSDMKAKSQEFYNAVKDYLSYPGGLSMSYEILVRACVIKYFEENEKESNINQLLNIEIMKGFIWIKELYNTLSIYENKREEYPTLMSYMPQIVKIQNNLNVSEVKQNIEQSLAHIESVNIKNEDNEVDFKIDHIIINFDKLVTQNQPVFYSLGETENYKPLTLKDNIGNSDISKMEWKIPIDLKPDTKYTIVIPRGAFTTKEGFSTLIHYFIVFKTKNE